MPRKEPLVAFNRYDLDVVLADAEGIRAINPQRHEMEHLTAIVYENDDDRSVVGYKDVSPDEFWVRGHMPGLPLMPGVIICEAAAQLASYYVQKNDLMGAEMMGFGGLDEVRFRDIVRPGDRLVIQCKQLKLRRGALVVCQFQGWVGQDMVVEGKIRGIPLPASAIRQSDAP